VINRDYMTRTLALDDDIVATAAAHANTGPRTAVNRRGPVTFLAYADRRSASIGLAASAHSGPLRASTGRLCAAARIARGSAAGPALLAAGFILAGPVTLV
jgi:hypothetical protein